MAQIQSKGENGYAYHASRGLGEVKTRASKKKHNQIAQGCYFRSPVAQAPCPWKRDAAITIISRITCILGVNIKKKIIKKIRSLEGKYQRLAREQGFGKEVCAALLFHILLRYKDVTKRHPDSVKS